MADCSDSFGAWRLKGSREALLTLLESSQATVYNLCFQVLRHPQDAEDVSQRVFLDLLSVLPRLDRLDHYRAWLHRACLVTALNYRRSERRRMRYEKALRPDASESLSDDDRELLHERLAHLEDHDRSVLVDHYLEQRTLEDLARERGCSTVAVWKHVRKAREALEIALRRAGYASLALAVGVFLESRRAEAAPEGLLSESVLAKASSVAGGSAPDPSGVGGGPLLNLKTMASIGGMLLLVGLLAGYTVYHTRQISRDERERTAAARKSPLVPALATRGGRPSADVDDRVVNPEAEGPVARFDSFMSFWAAFRKTCSLTPDMDRWREWRRIGLRRSDEQFCRIVARLRMTTGLRRAPDEALRCIFRDWMESDPGQVAAFLGSMPLAKNPRQWDSWAMAKPVLEEWSSQNPGNALALLKLLPSDWPTADAVREAQCRLRLAAEPDTFLRWLQSEAAGEERDLAMKVAIPYWASKDPLAAASWVEQLPSEAGKGPLGAIAREWARSSPEAALGWARKYLEPNSSVRATILSGLLQGAVTKDPEWAVDAALRWGGGNSWHTSAVLTQWTARDAAGVARFMDQGRLSDPGLVVEIVDKACSAWARTDPKAAIAWILRVPEPATRGHAVADIFSTWATAEDADPREIYKIIGTLPENKRAAAVNGLVSGWAQYDPAAAARFIDAIPPGGTTPTTVSALLRAWASSDLEASVAWVRTMPPRIRDEALRDTSMDEALSRDVAKAMSVAAEISDGAIRRDAQSAVLEFGAIYDPQAAAAVLATIPDPGPIAFRRVADGFLRLDPAAGLAWAQTLPETPLDHPLRAEFTRDMLLAYSRKDPTAAARWVEQASLPAVTKDALLAEIRKQRP